MQTFSLSLKLDCTAVITRNFLAEARAEAQKPDASLFLKTMQDKYPEDDDQFMLAIVKNAYRTTLRHGLHDFMLRSGVGGNVSPVQIVAEAITQKANDVVAFAEQTEGGGRLIEQDTKALQLPGAAVQGLIESRAESYDIGDAV